MVSIFSYGAKEEAITEFKSGDANRVGSVTDRISLRLLEIKGAITLNSFIRLFGTRNCAIEKY